MEQEALIDLLEEGGGKESKIILNILMITISIMITYQASVK